MVDRKAFSELLYKTVIPASMPSEEQEKLYGAVEEKAKEMLPKSLFRFRSCSEQDFSAFDNDELWFSTSDCMNDGFDARICVTKEDKDFVKKSFETQFRGYDFKTFSQQLRDANIPFSRETNNEEKEFQLSTFEKTKEILMNSIKNDVDIVFPSIPQLLQNGLKTCSLTETVNSSTMWGLYGKNETGFCVEYSFDTEPYVTSKEFRCLLFPVIYGKRRLGLSTDFYYYLEFNGFIEKLIKASRIKEEDIRSIPLASIPCPDIIQLAKITLTKSEDWSYEKEWRLLLMYGRPTEEKHYVAYKKPIGVYLGRRIASVNEKTLKLMAKEKNIPVYKMRINDESPSFELEYEQIQ